MPGTTISLTGLCSLSPLGFGLESAWKAYQDADTRLVRKQVGDGEAWVGSLSEADRSRLDKLKRERRYRHLDDSVLGAILASREAARRAGWNTGDRVGINVGSSRGATGLFESYHREFSRTGTVGSLASPSTTMGNIASWIAQDLRSAGPDFSHSITCSTALHALLNAVAWLSSGMSDAFLVGGSEAPLTPFTLAQMQALKIYSRSEDARYPSRPLHPEKSSNEMVLGEAAAIACLERGNRKNALAFISGTGYATETLTHAVSLSANATCLQDAMRMALGDHSPGEVDGIVLHAPGTVQGDLAEQRAVQAVFGEGHPPLVNNKWKIGHSLGASGMMSLELAVLILRHQQFIGIPYLEQKPVKGPIEKILVNAVGFGGNAVSILVERV